MNFSEFVAWSAVHRAQSGAVVACETRVHVALAALRPVVEIPQGGPPRVHRCHLAADWSRLRGAPAEWQKRALVCRGVRHALSLLFRRYAALGKTVALPVDVYPVYWQLAAEAGVMAVPFTTFPAIQLVDADVLLLPQPLKLHGRSLNDEEVTRIEAWLQTDAKRRLVMDAVYALGAPLDAATKQLMAGGRCIHLDSLSKAFLHEKVLGVAVLPEADVPHHQEDFRAEPPEPVELFTAARLLRDMAGFPLELRAELAARRGKMQQLLKERGVPVDMVPNGYLMPLRANAKKLLEEKGVLAIPLSVFGGEGSWCIASAL